MPLAHRLAHLLGLNRGRPVILKASGRYFRAFRCDCGRLQLVREMRYIDAIAWARDCCDRWELGPAKSGGAERP